jgi:hypothetical protein
LLLAWGIRAADSGYKAAFASRGSAQALVLEDGHGTFAVIVNAAFRMPLPVADLLAAQAGKDFGLDRANLLLHSTGNGEQTPRDVLHVIETAIRRLEPVTIRYGGGKLSAYGSHGCEAMLSDTAALGRCSSDGGTPLRGRIRAAYRIVDLTRGLRARNALPRLTAVQAIALGDAVLLLGVPDKVAEMGPGRIIAAEPVAEDDIRLRWALDEVVRRVRR